VEKTKMPAKQTKNLKKNKIFLLLLFPQPLFVPLPGMNPADLEALTKPASPLARRCHSRESGDPFAHI